MKQAKVVHLTSVHGPFDGRIFCKESKTLARAGYEVTVIAPHSKDEFVDGVQIKAVTKHKGRLGRMILTVWHVYREATRKRADVYHFHDPELIPVGLLLRVRGKKVVYDIHEDVPSTILDKYYLPQWVRQSLARLIRRVENLSCKLFSALIPATPAIAERFHALNRNTVVLNNYALREEFALRPEMPWSRRHRSVTYIGGISRDRGIREMLKAMELLPSQLQATLELVGPFCPANLKDEVACWAGWNRVESLGEVSRARVAEVLGSARAGLVLLHPVPRYVCSQPIKLFEYMAAGIPVIASDFPLWREIIETAGCGLLVDPLDPSGIANAIEYTLTHPTEAEAMGRRGREAVEKKYNWEGEEAKLLSCYAHLLGGIRTSMNTKILTSSP